MIEKEEPFQNLSELIKGISWGTHICYFYLNQEDLLDVLIPYFAEGLSNNEFCLWVCSKPLDAKRAKASFQERLPLPNPYKYLRSGQIKILDENQWYIAPGFSPSSSAPPILPNPYPSTPSVFARNLSASAHAPSTLMSSIRASAAFEAQGIFPGSPRNPGLVSWIMKRQ